MVGNCMLTSVCTNSSLYCELKELVKIDFGIQFAVGAEETPRSWEVAWSYG